MSRSRNLYTLHAVAGNLALVIHPDGKLYRYNMAWGDGIITYQLADHPRAFDPGVAGEWTFHRDVVFSDLDGFRVWWTYQRNGAIPVPG